MALFKLSGCILDGTAGTTLPTRQDLTFPQGEDVTFQVTITGQNGTAINITGYTGTMVWKFAQNSTMAPALTLSMNLTNPTSGIGTFTLLSAVSKGFNQSMFWWDCFVTSNTGIRDEVIPTSLITLNYSVGA